MHGDLKVTLFNLGRYEEAIEVFDKALQLFEKALKVDQNYIGALWYKGRSVFNLGRYEEAIEVFDKALLLDPNNLIVWNYKKLGKINM